MVPDKGRTLVRGACWHPFRGRPQSGRAVAGHRVTRSHSPAPLLARDASPRIPLTQVGSQYESPAMSSPFDGAGEPYRGASYRGWIIVAIVIVVGLAILWIAYGEALEYLPPGTPPS
jgi:hypothetical protein